MATELFLGKNQLAVDGDLKKAVFGWDHPPGADELLDVPFLQNFSRQTDGTGCVVSDHAVFDDDVQHRVLHRRLLSVQANIRANLVL